MSPGALLVRISLPGRLEADFEAPPGITAVIGPNGAGKTTLLSAIAGLQAGPGIEVRQRQESGERDLSALPAHQRQIGMVFQDHRLLPHLSARANAAFGARARGASRAGARAAADSWLARLGVADHAEARPGQLSGGQAQRVALARALASFPEVLLLDEPFAALDIGVAAGLRPLLAQHLGGFAGPALLATHDALDLHGLADRVLVLEDGAIAQYGASAEIAEAPATPHAARLLGLNVLDAADLVVLGSPAPGALATFAPSAITLTTAEPVGSARNRWPVTARALRGLPAPNGAIRVHLEAPIGDGGQLHADVTAGAAAELGLAPGQRLWASVKATEVTVLADQPAAATASITS